MGEKILIVDDNKDNLRLFQQILEEQNFQIFIATSGRAALRSLDEGIPDLILLDIMMPEMDGFETCRIIKNNPATSAVPVLFLSARGEIADETKGFSCGAVDYITKPVSVPILLARVRTHLNLKAARQSLERQNEELELRVRERTVHLEKTLEEKRLLLGEVHHRVLNNLQFIAGLILLQTGDLDEPLLEPLLSDYEDRIHSMAMVHRELYNSENFMEVDLARYAAALFRWHLDKLGIPGEKLRLDPLPDKAVININFAIPCGMILNEFFSLCLKNQKPVTKAPGFTLVHEQGGGFYQLTLCGSGYFNPLTDITGGDFSAEVLRLLVSQLRGEILPSDEGKSCRVIRFPDEPPVTYSDVSEFA